MTDEPVPCPECGRIHVMGCGLCGADLDSRDHYPTCELAPMVTKTGRALSEVDVQELADEAERGYPTEGRFPPGLD